MSSTDLGDRAFKKHELVFGDEVKPVEQYNDNGVRKFIFMRWMGGESAGLGQVAVLRKGGKRYTKNGVWVDGDAGVFVFEYTIFVPADTVVRVR